MVISVLESRERKDKLNTNFKISVVTFEKMLGIYFIIVWKDGKLDMNLRSISLDLHCLICILKYILINQTESSNILFKSLTNMKTETHFVLLICSPDPRPSSQAVSTGLPTGQSN